MTTNLYENKKREKRMFTNKNEERKVEKYIHSNDDDITELKTSRLILKNIVISKYIFSFKNLVTNRFIILSEFV